MANGRFDIVVDRRTGNLPLKICAFPGAIVAQTTDVLVELWFSEFRYAGNSNMAATATEKVTTTLRINKLLTIAAASKVQRKFEKAQAVRAAKLRI